MFDDSQIWLLVGVIVGAVAALVLLGIIINANITSRRLAAVLSDVEEMIHADLKTLEDKIDTVLTKLRTADTRGNRE